MSRVDLAELDFFSPEVQECPFSVYQPVSYTHLTLPTICSV